MRLKLPRIYPITDTRLSGLNHREQAERLIDGGATLIQLREKQPGVAGFFADALEATRSAHAANARVIINDRVDLAMAVGADGVHLGQDDLPPEAARKLLGDAAIIGYSTHTLEQAVAAVKLPVDYIAFGPIFPTATKHDTDPVVGTEMLACIRDAVGDIPLVAIGGINEENLGEVFAAGADSAALIGAIVSRAADIGARYRFLSKQIV